MLLMLIVSLLAFASGTALAFFETPLRINALMGNTVVNHEGERLGTVHDLVVNEEGLLEYLILAKGIEGVGGSEYGGVRMLKSMTGGQADEWHPGFVLMVRKGRAVGRSCVPPWHCHC
jgi:hypothetical protein